MEEWKIIKACDYCYNVTDGTHDSPKQKEVGKHLITSKHIKENRIDFENAYKISEEDYKKIISRSKVDQWDILISMIGAYCGFCCIESSTQTDYAIKNVGLFKIGDEIKCRWLYYYLTSPQGKEQLSILRSGSSQPYISLGALRNLDIPVPSTQYMESTISILKSLDDKIELNRRINENLEQQAQALFKSWFVDFEPFKDGKFVDSELGMIPEGWKVGELLDFGKIICGKTPSKNIKDFFGGDIPFIKIPDMHNQLFIVNTEDSLSIKGSQTQQTKLIPPYSLLVSCIATVGLVAINTKSSHTNQQINSIVPQNRNSLYYLYLNLILMKKQLENMGRGGTTTLNINTTSFGKIRIIIPSNEVLDNFSHIVTPLFKEIEILSKQTYELAHLRDTLLPKLMSGELKLSEMETKLDE